MSIIFPYFIVLIFFNILGIAFSAENASDLPLEEKCKVLSQEWEPVPHIASPVRHQDSRVCVGKDIMEQPWNCNFYLRSYYVNVPQGCTTTGHGTATLIDHNILLTAAHNLCYENDLFPAFIGKHPNAIALSVQYSDTQDTKPKSLIEIAIDLDENPQCIFVPNQYRDNIKEHLNDHDIALIILDEDDAEEIRKCGIIPVVPYTPPQHFFNEKKLRITGYSKAIINEHVTAYQPFTHVGSVHGIIGSKIFYDVEVRQGQSGSGILYEHSSGDVLCVGIHSLGKVFYNGILISNGVLLTREICDKIKQIRRGLNDKNQEEGGGSP